MQARRVDVPGAERQALAPEAAWHTLSAEEVLRAEEVDPRHGLSSSEAASRAGRFGPNTLAAGRAEPRWRAFIRQYSDPMQIVLLVVGLLSLFPLRQLGSGLLLILLTLANAVLGLQQEGGAESAVAVLQRRLIVTARVRRDGQEAEIPAAQLVPGDVVSIGAGDVVPADGRLLRVATLEVAESELTGESLPVSKGTAPVGEAGMPLGDRTDMVYMNTSVTRGTGEFVVTATGMATEVGHISGMLQAQSAVKTPLTRQLDRLSKQLLLIAGVALIASMAVNLSRGYSFNAVLPAAVAFAIAAVPVQLPMVVTTILAWGARALAKVGAIMKQLASTETLGSTSAINTDKTGTLTLNQMTAVQMVVAGHRYAVEGKGYSTDGRINRVAGQAEIPLDQFLMPMVLASDAVLSDGELIGDPTEGALVVLAAKGGIDAVLTRQVHPRIAELPFDAEYKLMATFHKMTDESGKAVIRCFVKGAPDQLLARAATVLDPDAGPVPLDGRLRERYLADNHRFAEEGLRVIATARRDFDPAAFDPGADLLPLVTDLELLALVGIVDPPRPGAKASVGQAKSAGIEVRMITGDHAVTAAAIARQLGIDGRVISGAEFGAMTDDEAMEAIADVGVIARVTPEHKVRLVDLLKREGQIVAMTGDGVNDAPALKQADCGTAVSGATDAARGAAALVLTAPGLSVINNAIDEARRIFGRITSYTIYRVALTMDIMFVVVLSTVFLDFSPLTAIMIVIMSLLDDAPIMTIAYDNTAVSATPIRWQMPRLLGVAVVLGLFSIVETFGLLLIGIRVVTHPHLSEYFGLATEDQLQTMIFLQLVAGGHLLLFTTRTERWFFLPPFPAAALFFAIVATQVVAVLMCGFGWLVPSIPWTLIGWVWVYNIAWMFVLGGVRLIAERFATYHTARQARSVRIVTQSLRP